MSNKQFYAGVLLLLVILGPTSYFFYEAYKDGNRTAIELEKERRQTELLVEQERRKTEIAVEEEHTKQTNTRWDTLKKSWFRNPFVKEE